MELNCFFARGSVRQTLFSVFFLGLLFPRRTSNGWLQGGLLEALTSPLCLASAAADTCGETTLTILIFAVGIALTSIFSLLFFITCLVGCCFSDKKSNSSAPTSSSKRLTFICVDVDQSVMFWKRDRVRTAHAIHAFNCVVRGMIKKYDCYEWWCSGSGLFMVVTGNAVTALKFAQHLHHRLLQLPFDKFFDNLYIEKEVQRQKEDPERLATSAFASEYDLIWSGLRVCIGLHSTASEVIKNNGTGCVDYGGTGGRIAFELSHQAHGGQTLMTSETYEMTFKTHKSLHKKFHLKEIVDDGQLQSLSLGAEDETQDSKCTKNSKKDRTKYLSHPYLLRLPSLTVPTLVYELVTVARREFPPFPASGFAPLYEYVTLISAFEVDQIQKKKEQEEKDREMFRRTGGLQRRASQLNNSEEEAEEEEDHPHDDVEVERNEVPAEAPNRQSTQLYAEERQV